MPTQTRRCFGYSTPCLHVTFGAGGEGEKGISFHPLPVHTWISRLCYKIKKKEKSSKCNRTFCYLIIFKKYILLPHLWLKWSAGDSKPIHLSLQSIQYFSFNTNRLIIIGINPELRLVYCSSMTCSLLSTLLSHIILNCLQIVLITLLTVGFED